MNLQQEQRHMLSMLKNDKGEISDTFLSEKLALQRKIIVWWRCFQFEHWLILTSKLLKDAGLLEALVSKLYRKHNISSYPAEAGEQFVEYILKEPISGRIKSVAMLELALINLKDPEHSKEYRILWNTPPFAFLDAILKGNEYSLDDGHEFSYEMILSNQIPGKIVVQTLA